MDEKWHTNLNVALCEKLPEGIYHSPSDDVLRRIGGFSLLYGQLNINQNTGKIGHLNILSNRGDHGRVHETIEGSASISDEVSFQTTFGLSNSLYNDPWRKVALGTQMLKETIQEAIENKKSLDQLVKKCFEVLSHDTYDREIVERGSPHDKLGELKNSIFIPPLEIGSISHPADCPTVGKYYGTRTQTIIIFDKQGNLHYFEKDVHNTDYLEDKIKPKVNHFQFNVLNK